MTHPIRPMTPNEFEELYNHPLIQPSRGIPENLYVFAGRLLEHPGNVGFITEIGGAIFCRQDDGVYEGHFFFLPGSGGKAILDASREMLSEMFTRHSAYVIIGHTPRVNRAARVISSALGFQKINNADCINELGQPCVTYVLRRWT